MAEQPSSIELTTAFGEVEAAIAQACAEWGVTRASVRVEMFTLPEAEGEPARVRLRLTRLDEAAPAANAVEDDEALATARQVLSELLEKMAVEATVEARYGEAEADVMPIILDIQGPDLGVLIGRKGETLAAMQYISRLIVAKQLGRGVDLIVDVQGHKQRREEQLRRMARRLAEQAVQRQRVMTLEPMPANERRIIHLELRDHPGVLTESVGEGTHRKVTIVPRTPPA